MLPYLVYAALAGLVVWMVRKYKMGKGPPGPTGLPIIGVAHRLNFPTIHHTLTQWSEEYGDVFKFTAMGNSLVVLNSFDTIQDALVKRSNEFAGRDKSPRLDILLPGLDIVTDSMSPSWLAMKKLSMQALKMYGSHLLVLEEISTEIIQDMVDKFQPMVESGEAFNPIPLVQHGITTIIASLVFGRKMSDESIGAILKTLDDKGKIFAFSASGMILDKFPWTKCLPGMSTLHDKLLDIAHHQRAALDNEIRISKVNFDADNVKCFTEAMIQHQLENKPMLENIQLSDDHIYSMVLDMMLAGTTTTTRTMQSLIGCLVNRPILQQRLAKQITEAIGERPVCLNDKPALPLVEAAILETLRLQTLLPLNAPHKTMADLTIKDYFLPKGTVVAMNLWKLHHDPEFWDDPFSFKPERFMENGGLVPMDHPNRKRLFPFGAGRRVCLGETLAKNRMFMIIASLLQKFTFHAENDRNKPQDDPRQYKYGVHLHPRPYKIIVTTHI